MFGNKKKKAEKAYRQGLEELTENRALLAKIHFENAVELNPDVSIYWWHYGECLLTLEQAGGVTMFTEKMLREGRTVKKSLLPQAYKCYKTVQELDGPSFAICERLGLITSQLEYYLDSIEYYKKAIEFLMLESPVDIEKLSGTSGNIGVAYAEILHTLAYTNNSEKILTELGYYQDDKMIVDTKNGTKIPRKEFFKQIADKALYYYKQSYDACPSWEIAQKNYSEFREFYEKNWS